MKNKKDLPLIIIQKLAPFVGKETDIYYAELKDKTMLLQVFDKDDKSDFYFFVTDYKKSANISGGSGYSVYMDCKPASSTEPGNMTRSSDVINLDKYFQNWITLISQYNKTPSFYDDPILEHYEEEYFTDFTESFGNEDQDKPFTTQQQFALDELFTNLKIELTKQAENKSGEQKTELQVVVNEITELQENIHLTNKSKVISKTSKIFAKLHKMGISFIKEIGTEVKKHLIKKIIDGTFDFTKTIDITEYFK